MNSILTKKQVKTFGPKRLDKDNVIVAEVSHDDDCNNGHNSFSLTATIYGRNRIPGENTITFEGKTYWSWACGQCHDDIKKAFPELASLIPWHLCSTDGPMHYIANALYWAGQSGYCNGKPNDPPNVEHLKSTIIFGALDSDAGVDPMQLAKEGKLSPWLKERLPALLDKFAGAVQSLGFTY